MTQISTKWLFVRQLNYSKTPSTRNHPNINRTANSNSLQRIYGWLYLQTAHNKNNTFIFFNSIFSDLLGFTLHGTQSQVLHSGYVVLEIALSFFKFSSPFEYVFIFLEARVALQKSNFWKEQIAKQSVVHSSTIAEGTPFLKDERRSRWGRLIWILFEEFYEYAT